MYIGPTLHDGAFNHVYVRDWHPLVDARINYGGESRGIPVVLYALKYCNSVGLRRLTALFNNCCIYVRTSCMNLE